MPPHVKYPREAVVQAAVSVVRRSGLSGLNARAIAAELGCSTQPLYSVLGSMEEVRAAVYSEAARLFEAYLSRGEASSDVPPYKASGLALLRFANEEKELYKLLLLRDRSDEQSHGEEPGLAGATQSVYQSIMQSTGYSLQTAKAFHSHMFVYIQGMASMLVSGYQRYDEALFSQYLTEEYQALRLLYDNQKA